MRRRHRSHRFLALGALAIAAWISPAQAAVHPVSQVRQVTTFAFLDAVPGEDAQRTQETLESIDPGAYSQQALCHLEEGGSQVTAVAKQVSEIGPGGVTADFTASAAGNIVPPARSTIGIGSTGLTYDFDVDAATPCHLTLQVEAHDAGVLDLRLGVRNGPMLVQRQFFDTEEVFDQWVSLPAGAYELTVGGGGDGGMGPGGSGTAYLHAVFSMELVGATSVAEGAGGGSPARAATWGGAKRRFEAAIP